ncbi:hypothetical protein JOQ06_019172 [Pogonophryne albipinna]|uniref:Claudin n=1 Tax=Pogonophryne albipinna TaxID=1090488 RepID=A0AAD6ASU3_9TELE|nr:hypothetical protein JOQ06_019172 [Pogonophryne albipinna]
MSMGMEIVGIALGVIGFILAIVTCALPMWRVTAFIGANIITAQTIMEGLWMNCLMMSIAIILGILGVLISIVGAKCTNCIEDEGAKAKEIIISGIFFVLGGLLVLIPVSWTASVVIPAAHQERISTSQWGTLPRGGGYDRKDYV